MTIPFLTAARFTRLRARATHWPASAVVTSALRKFSTHKNANRNREYRFRCMLLTTVDWKWPLESGPKRIESPVLTLPLLRMPLTTVPTYGTDQTSVTEYCSERYQLQAWMCVNGRCYLEWLINCERLGVRFAGWKEIQERAKLQSSQIPHKSESAQHWHSRGLLQWH
jgi:hypothetical protein